MTDRTATTDQLLQRLVDKISWMDGDSLDRYTVEAAYMLDVFAGYLLEIAAEKRRAASALRVAGEADGFLRLHSVALEFENQAKAARMTSEIARRNHAQAYKDDFEDPESAVAIQPWRPGGAIYDRRSESD